MSINIYMLLLCFCSASSTLCNPMDCSPPGSFVHGILQAKILEWVAISFSRGTSRPTDWNCIYYICRMMQSLYH